MKKETEFEPALRQVISQTFIGINGKSRLVNLVLLPLWYGNKDIIRDNISKCHR